MQRWGRAEQAVNLHCHADNSSREASASFKSDDVRIAEAEDT